MQHQETVTKIVDQFPWAYIITEATRPQLTDMIKSYLEADTFDNASRIYMNFMTEYFYDPLKSIDHKSAEYTLIVDWFYDKVNKWDDLLRQSWLDIHGPRHTRDEIMKLAADFWCERIFDSIVQDNGDTTEGGEFFMVVSSLLKSKSMKNQLPAVRAKAWSLIAEYYGKLFDCSLANDYENGLSVDYYPCESLHDILVNAGVDEKDVNRIVPFKTYLSIRRFDKTLVGTSGYGHLVYL